MQEYIFWGHTPKLTKRATPTKNYLSHHRDKNINQPDKIRIAFDGAAKIH